MLLYLLNHKVQSIINQVIMMKCLAAWLVVQNVQKENLVLVDLRAKVDVFSRNLKMSILIPVLVDVDAKHSVNADVLKALLATVSPKEANKKQVKPSCIESLEFVIHY
jgi:hypothetical protein